MTRKLTGFVVAIALLSSLVGCGGGDGPERVETPQSTAKAAEAANGWSSEQKDAMKKAMSERRNEDRGTTGDSK